MWAFLLVLLCATGNALSATPSEFYMNLFRRGVADFNAARYAPAVRELNIAAFGLLDSVDQFQMANVYIAIASDRLGREADARRAAQRVLAAERVNPRFAALSLAGDIRSAFADVSRKLLTTEELAVLGLPPRAPVSPAQPRLAEGNSASPQPQASAVTPETAQPPRNAAPQPEQSLPAVTVKPPAPVLDVAAQLAAAEQALSRNELAAARTIYTGLLEAPGLDRATLLRIAEGSYRARGFRDTVRAFERAGTLRAGEERYGYYLAVALYETGRYADARRAFDAARPFIVETPAVAAYRAKIESAAR